MKIDTQKRDKRVAQLSEDLLRLGFETGDTVLVRAGMKSIGVVRGIGRGGPVFLDALKRAVGDTGTIAALSFSKQDPIWKKSDHTYDRDSKTISGGFSQMIIKDPNAVRSRHPTNSLIAIGPAADRLVEGHDQSSTCFAPIRTLIEMGGKMALVGCIDVSPGFSSIHLAQEDLGLADRSLLKNLTGSHYLDSDGDRKWFSRRDVPGCSMGFSKGYAHYRKAGVLNEGKVGDADAMLISAQDAYDIEHRMLEQNPMSLLCDDRGCISCGTRTYNKKAWPGLLIWGPKGAISALKKAG